MKKMILLSSIFTSVILSAQELIPLTGIIKPIHDVKISISTEGKVDKLYLKEGDKVKKNQNILALDDKLQELETIRRELLYNDKTQLESLNQNLKVLKEILNKKQKLYNETKSISLNELQQLQMQYTNTKAELESLKVNEIKEKMELDISRKVLEYYKLKSPVDGVITSVIPKVGEWVQAGKEIVQIVNTDTCFVEVDLSVNDLKTISLNSQVNVEVFDGQETIIKKGKVTFISAIADSSSGLIRAKIDFDNKDKKAIPGLTANIILN